MIYENQLNNRLHIVPNGLKQHKKTTLSNYIDYKHNYKNK